MPDETPDWAPATDTATATVDSDIPDWAPKSQDDSSPDWAPKDSGTDTPATDSALRSAIPKTLSTDEEVGLERQFAKEHPYIYGAAKAVTGMVPKSVTDVKAMTQLPRPAQGVDVQKENELGAQWRGERGPEAQAESIVGTALQALPLVGLPFAESPLRPTLSDLSTVNKLREAQRATAVPTEIAEEDLPTDIREQLQHGDIIQYEDEHGQKHYYKVEQQGGETDASTIASTESVSEREVRPQVGEEAPLRQQGETAGAQEQPVAPSQPVATEVPQEPDASGERIVTTAWKLPSGEVIDSGRQHSSITNIDLTDAEKGFITSTGRFVEPEEAGKIATGIKQKVIAEQLWGSEKARRTLETKIPDGGGGGDVAKLAPVPKDMINAVRTPRGRITGYNVEHGDAISALSESHNPSEITSGWVLKRPTKAETDATFIGTDDVQRHKGDFQAAFDEKLGVKPDSGGGGTVRLYDPEKPYITATITPSARSPGKWQGTIFGPEGPAQHIEADSQQQVYDTLKKSGFEPKPELPEPKLTSTKNSVVDQERVSRGLQPIAADAGTAHPETWAKAEKRLSENPLAGKMLVEDIVDRGREEFSTTDEAVLLREKIATQTARQGAADRVLDPNLSESDRTQARSDFDALEAHSQRIDEAMHKTGAKWSEFGRFRQLLAADDYSLRGMGDRLRIAKGKKTISPEEIKSVQALHDKISDLQGKLDAHEAARTFDTEFKKLVGQSIKEAKAAKTKGTRFTEFMDQKANEARQRIVAKRGRLTTGFDPTAITDEAIIGASHIAKGLTKFADWSGQMLKEFGERVRPYLKDIWERAKSLHDANAREYGDKSLARYKTYLGKQTEQIKSKMEAGDFTKAQRQKTKLDAEAFTMRANLQKLKNEFERGVNKEAYKNKTPAQKFWDHFVGVERAMKLSGPSVFGKLGVAAMTREVLSPIEASVGYGASKIVPRFAAGTRYGAGFRTVLRSEIKAKAAFFTKGMKELAENVRGKETELDALSGKYGSQPRFWYNRIGDMHAAIKAPVKRAAFTRSLETRMESAVKAGEDINHPEVMTRLSNEAVMDANREIFQENTVVSSMFKMIENKSPVAGRVARFLFPVVKIPVNLFKEFVNLHVGAPVAATRIGMAYWKGVESLPALQREAIIRQLVKGSIGGAGLLWGYYNSDKVRSFFDKVPQWFAHTPMAMVLNEGSYLKDLGGTPEQGKQARKELAYMAKSGIPFMYSITDVTSALDANNSHALLNWINNMTQSTVVPQISSQLAKTMDKPGTFPSNIAQKPNWRVARNPVEAVKLGIPGLRTQVPQHFPRSGGSSSSRNERRSQR